MNEEQLKEIATIAKELGFKPITLTTGVTFEKFTRVDKGLPVNDTCYYLLLCEIQLWLNKDHFIFVDFSFNTIGSDEWVFSYNIVYLPKINHFTKRRCSYLQSIDSFAEGIGSYVGGYHTKEDALAVGILKGLKLIKNESN